MAENVTEGGSNSLITYLVPFPHNMLPFLHENQIQMPIRWTAAVKKSRFRETECRHPPHSSRVEAHENDWLDKSYAVSQRYCAVAAGRKHAVAYAVQVLANNMFDGYPGRTAGQSEARGDL